MYFYLSHVFSDTLSSCMSNSFSLSLCRYFLHTLSYTCFLRHSLPLSVCLTLFHSLSLSAAISYTLSLTYALCLSVCLSVCLSNSFFLSLSLPLFLTHSLLHMYSICLTLSVSHIRYMHSVSLSLSFYLSIYLFLPPSLYLKIKKLKVQKSHDVKNCYPKKSLF